MVTLCGGFPDVNRGCILVTSRRRVTLILPERWYVARQWDSFPTAITCDGRIQEARGWFPSLDRVVHPLHPEYSESLWS